jgi:hypothetical protein
MKIYINEEILDSKIDKEETIGEIYSEIKKWAESQGKFVLQCLVDGAEMQQDQLNKLEIRSAERLDFYVGENLDVLISGLIELDKYIDTVGNTLLGRDSLTEKEHRDLKDGVHWISEVMESAKNLLKLDYSKITPLPGGSSLQEIIGSVTQDITHLDSISGVENYLEKLRDLKLFTMTLINKTSILGVDLNTIKEVISTYADNMEILKKEFIRINENFQSGKDAVAGELLNHSIGRLHVMLSSFVSLKGRFPEYNLDAIEIEGETLGDTIEKLNTLLSEVAKSLEINDIVMAGDLLEYELPDILEKFVPFLRRIKEIIS